MRMATELSYPLDPETASAVDAAQKHHVMSWEESEEGGDLDTWLLRNYLAEGKMALPDGAYLVRDGIESRYHPIPSPNEVRALFKDEDSFRKFQDVADYSYGLADVPDAAYEERYEELLQAVKGVVKAGTFVDLPTVPHDFLREAPLIDGDWIDRHVVALAEWGATIRKEGYAVEDSEDHHPLAWCRIVDPTDGSKLPEAVLAKLRQDATEHIQSFPGRIKEIDGRPYLSFSDYVKWGRQREDDPAPDRHYGINMRRWNQRVEADEKDDAAILAGVTVGELRVYFEKYRHHVCDSAKELVNEVGRRESFLDSYRPERPSRLEGRRCYKRVRDWKDQAEYFLTEIYTLRMATEVVKRQYFDGQPVVFAGEAKGLDHLITLIVELIGDFNEDLASRLEDQLWLGDAGSEDNELPWTIDLTAVTEKVEDPVDHRVSYVVDMAKAEALGLLGETEEAAKFADRHFQPANAIDE